MRKTLDFLFLLAGRIAALCVLAIAVLMVGQSILREFGAEPMTAAEARAETRGCHHRSDFPDTDPAQAVSRTVHAEPAVACLP